MLLPASTVTLKSMAFDDGHDVLATPTSRALLAAQPLWMPANNTPPATSPLLM
jgi:hypothetical protein